MTDEEAVRKTLAIIPSALPPYRPDERLVRVVVQAIRDEREACAMLADPPTWSVALTDEVVAVRDALKVIANSIRARGS
jgi:hypothetical protein